MYSFCFNFHKFSYVFNHYSLLKFWLNSKIEISSYIQVLISADIKFEGKKQIVLDSILLPIIFCISKL